MADSPASSDLSDPPSVESDAEEAEEEEVLSTALPSSRPSVDTTHTIDADLLAPPSKRRKTGPTPSHLSSTTPHDTHTHRPPSSSLGPAEEADNNNDNLSLSSDGWSSGPPTPTHDEYAMRDEAQTWCLWRDCSFGEAGNNDDLVRHVQGTHCATGGPKRTKYVCEWGECQRKTSNHPSGYALKAHMRSHTKEKPYYCALPECDKSFTRSDALAKHMRTVHEPEPARASTTTTTTTSNDPTPPGKKPIKLKLTNGSSSTTITGKATAAGPPPTPTTATMPTSEPSHLPPTHDEDGNPVDPSPATDNIAYIPAHHPITGQPGFMITYPPDIHFTAWESSIAADQLMRLLRRQLHWARKEGEQLKRECRELERRRREEWQLKEILLEGVMEAELARGDQEGWLRNVDLRVRGFMEEDVASAKHMNWTGDAEPAWRLRHANNHNYTTIPPNNAAEEEEPSFPHLSTSSDSDSDSPIPDVTTPPRAAGEEEHTPSPPPTGHSGGFDGDADPYDNYLAARMAEYEQRQQQRRGNGSGDGDVKETQMVREADAVGALVGMSGK